MAQSRLHSSPFSARGSPRLRRNADSPSRQLQWDLERALSQIHLHEIESTKLHAYQKRQQQEELDAREAAQANVHQAELNAANAQHEVVRRQAEAVLQAYMKQEEEERQRRLEEEQQRLEEEERRRKAEEEARRRAEEQRRARDEEERRAQEQRRRQEAEQAERRAHEKAEAEESDRREKEAVRQKQQEDKAKADKEAAARQRQQAEAEAAAAVRAVPEPQPVTTSATVGRSRGTTAKTEQEHKNYLTLHKKLKTFRSEFWASTRQNPALKPHVGDMRRAMKTSVGQLTDDKATNKVAQERVKTTLLRALRELPSQPVPVNDFLPAHLNLGDNNSTTVPSLLLYLLNIFSKAVIAAFVGECAVNLKAAEPIGTLIAQTFSMPELQLARNGSTNTTQSLIPILMCKFHATAPILFGIYGPESTSAGRLRLGWRRDNVGDAESGRRAFTLPEKHYDRLTGLGVGYASVALRNFSKARFQNPWPPSHFWSSLAHVINTPPREVQTSHLILLKNMLENNAIDRFVLFFGAAGIAALRQAVAVFPKTLPEDMQKKQVTQSLQLMVESWKKENHFSLV